MLILDVGSKCSVTQCVTTCVWVVLDQRASQELLCVVVESEIGREGVPEENYKKKSNEYKLR